MKIKGITARLNRRCDTDKRRFVLPDLLKGLAALPREAGDPEGPALNRKSEGLRYLHSWEASGPLPAPSPGLGAPNLTHGHPWAQPSMMSPSWGMSPGRRRFFAWAMFRNIRLP